MRFESPEWALAGLLALSAVAAIAQQPQDQKPPPQKSRTQVGDEQVNPGQNDPPDATSVQTSLRNLKSLVNPQNYSKLGFQTPQEASAAVLGTPVRRYIVRPDKLLAYQKSIDPASILEDPRQWIYPVMVNGAVRCAVTIAWRKPGSWKTISYGDQGLARALFNTRREESLRLKIASEAVFFLVDVLSSDRKFVARRTDGKVPERTPGIQRLQFTWLAQPPGTNQKTQSAEATLLYLSQLAQSRKGAGAPGQ